MIFLATFCADRTYWISHKTTTSPHEQTFQEIRPRNQLPNKKKAFFADSIHAIHSLRSLQNKTHLFEIDCIIESHHIVLMKRWVIAEVRRVLPQPALHILAIHLSFCLSGNRIRKSCKRQCSGIPQQVCPSKLQVSSTTCADCERTV